MDYFWETEIWAILVLNKDCSGKFWIYTLNTVSYFSPQTPLQWLPVRSHWRKFWYSWCQTFNFKKPFRFSSLTQAMRSTFNQELMNKTHPANLNSFLEWENISLAKPRNTTQTTNKTSKLRNQTLESFKSKAKLCSGVMQSSEEVSNYTYRVINTYHWQCENKHWPK